MRIYKNCLEMVKEVERDLFEMGIVVQSNTVQDIDVRNNKDYETLELFGYSYKVTNFEKMDEMLDYMGVSKEWVETDFRERVNVELINPGNAWKINKELWGRYLHDGEFEYTYNERIRDQLPYLLCELNRNKNTRQGIITMYDQHKDMRNWGGKARVPCSLSYQFLYRDNNLHLLYVMRSCDLLKHFVGDVALAILLLKYVASKLSIDVGTFTHFMGSLHAFKKDLDKKGIF